MARVKILTMQKVLTRELLRYFVLLAIAVISPFFFRQEITGTLVNAVLFIAAALLGVKAALSIAVIPSLIAVSVALLPPPLAPMIPFIILGNAILIFVFDRFNKKNFWLGMISAAFCKFIFLAATSSQIIRLFIKGNMAPVLSQMFSFPQLFTALAGGILAYLILRPTFLKNGNLSSSPNSNETRSR